MSPERTNLVLPTHVPDVKLGVFVRHGLDVEADGRYGCYVGVELELVEDRWGVLVSSRMLRSLVSDSWLDGHTCLPCRIQAQHEEAHFF